MRTFLLLSFLAAGVPALAQAPAAPKPAPAPAAPKPTPPQPAPAQPRPARPRPAAAANERSGIAIVVTDMDGVTLSGIHVQLSGGAARTGDTDAGGQINFPGLQGGTYRLRFSGDNVTAFEREVTLRSGAIERLEIKLSAAEAPRAVTPPPAAPPPARVGPVGAPQIGSLLNLAERERGSKQPRREVLLSCSGNTRNMLVVLTEELSQRLYDSAEATFYVMSGQGGARIGSLQSMVGAGSFIAVPRGTSFSIGPQGKNPLVMLWTLSGEPCEQAR